MDELKYLSNRIKLEFDVPSAVLPDLDGFIKSSRVLAKAAPLAKFERTAQATLVVLKNRTNGCLRNGFIQALSCNDFQTASKCRTLLKNLHVLDAVSCSLTNNSYVSDYGCIRKNISSLSVRLRTNNSYRFDRPQALIDSSGLSVIKEYEKKTKDGHALEQVRNRVADDYELRTSHDRNGREKPQRIPHQTRNVSDRSDSEQGLDSPPRRPRNYGKAGSNRRNEAKERYGKHEIQADDRLRRRSESEDSEELFRPSQSKKVTQERRRGYEARYKQSSSRRGRSESPESSDVDSSPRRLPRRVVKRSRKQKTSYSESDQEVRRKRDGDRGKFVKNNKRPYSKYDAKQCYSDSDILTSNNNESGPSKTKRRQYTDSESETQSERSKTVERKCSDRRRKVSKDYTSQGPSRRQDTPPRRSRSAGNKSWKRAESRSPESSVSPSPSRCKQPVKPKRGKPKASLSDSEVVLDSKGKKKPTQSDKKLKDSEPRSAKTKGKAIGKSVEKKANKPVANKVQTEAGKSNDKRTVNRKRKSTEPQVEEKDKLPIAEPSTSKFVSKLKELESTILDGAPDPLTDNKKKGSKTSANKNKNATASKKKTQESVKKGKSRKTPSKSPGTEVKQKPSDSKVQNRKTPALKTQEPPSQKLVADKGTKKKAVNTKAKRTVVKGKAETKKPRPNTKVKQTKENSKENEQQPELKDEKTDNVEDDKNMNSLLSSDESFFSSSELGPPLSSLSTCLNSIKRHMPKQVDMATPQLRIFRAASSNSDLLSDKSETSSFHQVPVKQDDKNIVKRMAKIKKPKQVDKKPSSSKPTGNPDTPENLRKMVKINKKLEDKQDSSFESSSSSEN